MSRLNVSILTVEEVCDWIAGIGLKNVAEKFKQDEIDGQKLMRLESDDLAEFSFFERESVLSVADKLYELYFSLDKNTLQTLSLKFLYMTQTLQKRLLQFEKIREDESAAQKASFSAIVDSMNFVKSGNKLMSWLKCDPFNAKGEYCAITDQLSIHIPHLERKFETNKHFEPGKFDKIMNTCDLLIYLAERLLVPFDVHASMPCILHLAVIDRSSAMESLGIVLVKSEFGDCVIEEIIPNSPAHKTRDISVGDEVIKVNGKLTVGWSIHSIGTLLSSIPTRVVLLVKKRPLKVRKFWLNRLDPLNWKKKNYFKNLMDSVEINFDDQIEKRSMESIRRIDSSYEPPLFACGRRPLSETESSYEDSSIYEGCSSKASRSSVTTDVSADNSRREEIDWETANLGYNSSGSTKF